jgi:cytoskeletal protein CcmA (bactofilin family)
LAGGNINVSGPVSSWNYNVGGNVSSNGNVIVNSSGKIIGSVSAVGTVTNSGGTIGGSTTQHVTPPFTVALPAVPTLVASNVTYWQNWYGNQAMAGGTTGSENVGTGNLGPVYIAGDLTIGTNAVVQLTGTVYVTGSVTIKEGVTIYGPGTIVAEGTYSDKEGSVYGAPGEEVMLMSLSTAGISTKTNGNEYCVFYDPFGPINFQNWDTVNGAVIGQGITSNNGFSASWTSAVYNIPGLPGVYVPGSPGPGSTVQQTTFNGPVIDWYKVCNSQSCSP